jgi:hypothetical protein
LENVAVAILDRLVLEDKTGEASFISLTEAKGTIVLFGAFL